MIVGKSQTKIGIVKCPHGQRCAAVKKVPSLRRPQIQLRAAKGDDRRGYSYEEQQYTGDQSTYQGTSMPEVQAGEEAQQPGYPGPPPPYSQQQYYQAYPSYPPYPVPQQETKAGGTWFGPFIWVAVGAVIATVYQKVTSFIANPQAAQARMMSWAMEQAMNQGKQGGAAPGANPFAGMNGGGGMPPGFGFPPMPPSGFSSPPNGGQTVDTTAKAVDRQPAAAAAERPAAGEAATGSNGESQRGARFEELKAQGSGRRRAEKPKRAAFKDVDEDEASTSNSNGSSAGFGGDVRQAEVVGEGTQAGASSEGGSSKFTVDLLDQFFKDPNMQQLLYKYLPEPMRNPQTFEWMLQNPEYRKQLEAMMEQQGMNLDPNMMNMMKDLDSSEMNKQLETLGLSPSEVINKIMAEPDLAAAFQKPKVMQAIMESQSNPLAIMNYQDDPDVMLVFEKMAKLFPQTAGEMPPMQ
ncbi:g4107 [Coccomyxa elongata]